MEACVPAEVLRAAQSGISATVLSYASKLRWERSRGLEEDDVNEALMILRDVEGHQLLHWAALHCHRKLTRELLDNYLADVNAVGGLLAETPLMWY
jgi:hypothetical protein